MAEVAVSGQGDPGCRFALPGGVFLLSMAVGLVWRFASPTRTVEWDLWAMLESIALAGTFAAVIGGGIVILAQLVETVDSRHLAV